MDSQTDVSGQGSEYVAVLLVALVCALFAIGLSCMEIYQHLLHYVRPEFQMHIVRVLGMVPIYSLHSLVSLLTRNGSTLDVVISPALDVVRDGYEAYVIYNFLVLLINYCGGERRLVHSLELMPRLNHFWPCSTFLPPMKLGINFMHFVRSACLQFVFVKPAGALCVLLAFRRSERLGHHIDLIVTFINNISVTLALYGLLCFYHAAAPVLRPFHPLPKFLSVKMVIFFSFWQQVALSAAIGLGLLHDVDGFSARDQASGLQDVLVCAEMAIAAVCHMFVFNWREVLEYPPADRDGSSPAIPAPRDEVPLLSRFGDIVDIRDVLSDAKDSIYGSHFERELHDKHVFVPATDSLLDTSVIQSSSSAQTDRFPRSARSGSLATSLNTANNVRVDASTESV